MNPIIRNMTLADAQEATNVHIATWQSTYKGIVPQAYLDEMSDNYEERVEKLKKTLSETSSKLILVAEVDRRIVGILYGGQSRHPEYPHDKEVYAIYVLDQYQGYGVGKKLIQAAMKSFVEEESKGVIIWVLEENKSKGFYEAIGGKYLGNKIVQIAGKPLDERGYGWMPIPTVYEPRGTH